MCASGGSCGVVGASSTHELPLYARSICDCGWWRRAGWGWGSLSVAPEDMHARSGMPLGCFGRHFCNALNSMPDNMQIV